jgi:hypothetical protein
MARSLRDALNESNPNKLPDGCREVKLGSALSLTVLSVVGKTVGTVLPLPESLKARFVAGAGVNRTAGAAVTPTIDDDGNLVFAGASTNDVVEGHYVAYEGDVREAEISVVASTGVGKLPTGVFGAQLLEVDALEGTSTGTKDIVARGGTPAAGEAALNFDGNTINFLAADAVTKARVKFIAQPEEAMAARLAGETNL